MWRRAVASAGLSEQQARTVRLLLQGRSDRQIAEALGIGLPTVCTYLSRLFAKTGTHDRVGLLLHIFAILLEDCRRNGRHQKQ